jgi:hypothetical protein
MAMDVLPIEKDVYTWSYSDQNGQEVTKQSILDEKDALWTNIRYDIAIITQSF